MIAVVNGHTGLFLASAQGEEKAKPAAEERQLSLNNYAALQNQQARVVVLQQLLNRESAELRQMEAVFCDQYRLDPEKWRKGAYRWDEKKGKFVEQPQD